MTNRETYIGAFSEALEIEQAQVETATTQNVETWDSIKQMVLIATLEDAFSIEIDPEDIIALNSFENGISILKKYNVVI